MSEFNDDVDALWRAVFGEPPPMRGDRQLLCELLVRYLPAAPPYAPGGRHNIVRRPRPPQPDNDVQPDDRACLRLG